jgi:hypothetical protein
MKTRLSIILLAAALVLAGCAQEENNETTEPIPPSAMIQSMQGQECQDWCENGFDSIINDTQGKTQKVCHASEAPCCCSAGKNFSFKSVNDQQKSLLGKTVELTGRARTLKGYYLEDPNGVMNCLFLDNTSLLQEFQKGGDFWVEGVVESRVNDHGECGGGKQECGKELQYCVNVKKIGEVGKSYGRANLSCTPTRNVYEVRERFMLNCNVETEKNMSLGYVIIEKTREGYEEKWGRGWDVQAINGGSDEFNTKAFYNGEYLAEWITSSFSEEGNYTFKIYVYDFAQIKEEFNVSAVEFSPYIGDIIKKIEPLAKTEIVVHVVPKSGECGKKGQACCGNGSCDTGLDCVNGTCKMVLTMFHNNAGPMCLEQLEFLDELKQEHPHLEVKEYYTFEEGTYQVMSSMKTGFTESEGYSKNFGYLPITFFKGRAFSGFNEHVEESLTQLASQD